MNDLCEASLLISGMRVPVTKWVSNVDDIEFCKEDFVKKNITFGIAVSNNNNRTTYSIYRELMDGDPCDPKNNTILCNPDDIPNEWYEVYKDGILVSSLYTGA